MSVSIQIVPLSPSVDIHGSPEAGLSTAYSLSGHVLISLASPVAFFDSRPRPTRMLLSSLELTFEGKSEYISDPSGYVAARIISLTKELLPDGQPIELTNEGHEDSASPSTWQVVFNLALPGWIPCSTIYGSDDLSNVSYGLHCRATYSHIEDDHGNLALWKPWKLASLCTAALRTRNKTAHAQPTPIYINRVSTTASSFAHYSIRVNALEGTLEPNAVPAAILSNIQVLASIPTQLSTTASDVPVSLRIRSTNDPDVTARIRINSFHIDLEQHEKYQTSRSHSYAAAFPIPRSAQQPPSRPLLDPHPLETLYSLGLMCCPESADSALAYRSWSIVPADQPLLFRLHERAVDSEDDDDDGEDAAPHSGRIVQDSTSPTPQGLILESDGWHKISVRMPLNSAPIASTCAQTFFDDDDFASAGANYYAPEPKAVAEKGLKAPESHSPRRIVRPTYDSPFFKVRHDARIVVTCSYRDSPEGPEYQSEVKFSLPLKFVCTLPAELARAESPSTLEASGPSRSGSSTPVHPSTAPSPYPRTHPLGTSALPAYSQLYHTNGDWRDELYADLPAYSKDAEEQPLLGLAH
ncbi:hypothetical protein EXIGLDRAFT_775475 [Exidia glandulosa HHB12029]|uniref:Uncharacterized protein n=1 Tax=Exidia glandulosa HHB12029 TaxID=1314781 RepID=A0A165DWK9_EXIGL|nr:hypothetical protein EXIGLDRAFT_775475 [Exidia glandulosa HHB12029]